MATMSFKTDEEFKKILEDLASYNGITASAYIKLTLTKGMKSDLAQVTENGLTVAEELEIIRSDKKEGSFGPFTNVEAVMKALKK